MNEFEAISRHILTKVDDCLTSAKSGSVINNRIQIGSRILHFNIWWSPTEWTIYVDDFRPMCVVGAQLRLRNGNQFFWRLSARDPDPDRLWEVFQSIETMIYQMYQA